MTKPKPCKRCGGTGVEADWLAIGAKMRKRRLKLGVSLRELARQCNVTAAYLSDMENGKRAWRGPKARTVARRLEA